MNISSGSTYSSAITANGELYTWGRGNYGRLGHGSSEDSSFPSLVSTLKGHRIIDIACGSGDAQTIAVSDTGMLSILDWATKLEEVCSTNKRKQEQHIIC